MRAVELWILCNDKGRLYKREPDFQGFLNDVERAVKCYER